MKLDEYNDRNYDVSEIEEDPRFITCFKEAKLVIGFWFTMVTFILVAMYTIGAGDPKNYTYVAGLPLWFFVVCMIFLVFIGIGLYIVKNVLKDMSLDDEI